MTKSQLYKQIIYRLLLNMKVMLFSFIKALPIGILVGVVVFVIIKQYQKKTHKDYEQQRRNALVLLISYITIMLQITIFLRPFGHICEIDIIPFDAPGGFRYIILYCIANMLIFVPIGIWLPMIWKKMNNIRWMLLAGFLGSLFIELSQFVLQCGASQTEDLIMNTIGAGIGYWIYNKSYVKVI